MLDNYDDFDFNPKATGESNKSASKFSYIQEEAMWMRKTMNAINMVAKECNVNNLDCIVFLKLQFYNFYFKTKFKNITWQGMKNIIEGIE